MVLRRPIEDPVICRLGRADDGRWVPTRDACASTVETPGQGVIILNELGASQAPRRPETTGFR